MEKVSIVCLESKINLQGLVMADEIVEQLDNDHASKNSREGYSQETRKNDSESTETSLLGKQDISFQEIALNGEEAKMINYFSFSHVGLFLQYFFVGIVYAYSLNLNYEFFRQYLGQSGNFYNVCRAAIGLPWTFKLFFGTLNDCVPIFGYRRKPYMIMGWVGCVLICTILAVIPLPEPRYIMPTEEEINNGNCDSNELQYKPDSADEYGAYAYRYMCLLFLLNMFLVLTDVAMDGLMVQYGRQEPEDVRGRAQSMIYVFRQFGIALATLIKGFGLNWYAYEGPWCRGIDVTELFIIAGIGSALAVPTIIFMTTEEKVKEKKHVTEVVSYTWTFMQKKVVQQIILFQIVTGVLMSISSPADSMILAYWVHMDNLTNNLLGGVLAMLVFNLGVYVFNKFFIDKNWRITFGVTSVLTIVINSLVTNLVIFAIIRNQYFYVSDAVLLEFIVGVNYICGLLLFIEVSEAHTEGICYALLTTFSNLSSSIGMLFGNYVAYPFHVSSAKRYDRDSFEDRQIIAVQYGLIHIIMLSSLFALPLLPQGKKKCQELKQKMGTSTVNAIMLLITLVVFYTIALLDSFLLYRYH